MGRLIDADELKYCKILKAVNISGSAFLREVNISDIPTAYDAGMIVEQLEKEYISARCNNNKPCNYPETIGCCYDKAITKAIEIVKGGGQGE